MYQRPLYGLATLFLWLKVFYFLRIFKQIGHLVRMIFAVMFQMRFFFVVFGFFVLAFTNAFYALSDTKESGFTQNLMLTYFITMRKADTQAMSESTNWALMWFVYMLASLFFSYIMLNLTVSMVKGYYDGQMRIKTESAFQVMAQLTLESYHLTKVPKAEKQIDQTNRIESATLQPGCSDCQYLLVAQTVMEESESTVSEVQEIRSAVRSEINQAMKDMQGRSDGESA